MGLDELRFSGESYCVTRIWVYPESTTRANHRQRDMFVFIVIHHVVLIGRVVNSAFKGELIQGV